MEKLDFLSMIHDSLIRNGKKKAKVIHLSTFANYSIVDNFALGKVEIIGGTLEKGRLFGIPVKIDLIEPNFCITYDL